MNWPDSPSRHRRPSVGPRASRCPPTRPSANPVTPAAVSLERLSLDGPGPRSGSLSDMPTRRGCTARGTSGYWQSARGHSRHRACPSGRETSVTAICFPHVAHWPPLGHSANPLPGRIGTAGQEPPAEGGGCGRLDCGAAGHLSIAKRDGMTRDRDSEGVRAAPVPHTGGQGPPAAPGRGTCGRPQLAATTAECLPAGSGGPRMKDRSDVPSGGLGTWWVGHSGSGRSARPPQQALCRGDCVVHAAATMPSRTGLGHRHEAQTAASPSWRAVRHRLLVQVSCDRGSRPARGSAGSKGGLYGVRVTDLDTGQRFSG